MQCWPPQGYVNWIMLHQLSRKIRIPYISLSASNHDLWWNILCTDERIGTFTFWFCRSYYKMYMWCNYLMTIIHLYCDKFLYPIGWLTLYGLTERTINEWTKNVVLEELLNNLMDIIPLCFQWSTNNLVSCHQTQVHIFVCNMQATFPAELIRAGGRTICSEIHKLINFIWKKGELSEEWKESITVPIYQKWNK
jgi:hypothetical protein